MSGYAVYLNFQFMNLCVKAEPAALLPVTVVIDGESKDIEEVADVALPNKNQFVIIPKESSYLFPICKALSQAHPEFEIERKNEDSSVSSNNEETASSGDDEDNEVIYCTMPPINKDRRDTCMDFVKTVSDEAKAKIEVTYTTYTARITAKMAGESAESIEEATNELDDIHKQHTDICKEYRENIEKEIEGAYQKYVTEQEEKEKTAQEQMAARGENAGSSMRMEDSERDNGSDA